MALVAVLAASTIFAPSLARAAPADDVAALVKSASAAFAQSNWDEARQILGKAESQAKANGLAADKLMARILVHQGAVMVSGDDKPGEAVQVFRRALKIDPNAKLTSTLAKTEVLDAFKKAVIMERAGQQSDKAEAAPAAVAGTLPPTDVPVTTSPPPEGPRPTAPPSGKAAPPKQAGEADNEQNVSAASGGAPAVAPPQSRRKDVEHEEPDLPVTINRPLHCPNPDEAPPGKKAVLHCVAQPDLDVGRVLLHYRLPGSEEYEKLPATKTPRGWYVAIVPAKAFSGRMFQYYFEARDPTDAPVAENGRYESPNLMMVRQGASPVTHSANAPLPSSDASNIESDDSDDDDPLSRLSRMDVQEGTKYWVALSFGRGFGFHGDQELEWYGVDVSGAARSASLLHLAPEFGIRLLPQFAVALQGRNQVIRHTGREPGKPGSPAVGANSLLLRLIWLLPIGTFSNIQLSAIGGGGEGFRLVAPPNEVQMRQSSDTVRGGPFLVGAGVHSDIGFGRAWAMRLGVEVLTGLPKAATVIDFGLGGVYRF